MPFVLICLPTTGRGRKVCREVPEAGSLKAVGEGLNPVTDPIRDPLSQDRREVTTQEEGITGVKEPQLPLLCLLYGRLRGLRG